MVVLDHRHLSKTLSKHYDITRATSSWITGNDERRDRYLSRALREAQGTGDVIVSVIVNENRENMRMFDKRVPRGTYRSNITSTCRLCLHQVELQSPLYTLIQAFPQLDNCFIP